MQNLQASLPSRDGQDLPQVRPQSSRLDGWRGHRCQGLRSSMPSLGKGIGHLRVPFFLPACHYLMRVVVLNLSTALRKLARFQRLLATLSGYHIYGTLVPLPYYILCGMLQISEVRLTL